MFNHIFKNKNKFFLRFFKIISKVITNSSDNNNSLYFLAILFSEVL